VDVLPTLLELVGVPAETEAIPLAGASLGPLLRGESDSADRTAFFAGHLNDDPLDEPLLAGVRTPEYKLIVDACTDQKLALFEARLARQAGAALKADLRGRLLREMHAAPEPVKLYDLAADPLETRNIATERPDVVAALRTRVDRFLGVSTSTQLSADEDAALEEQLRALGYLT
jgi:arylsulfatase A-like enzyme